MSVTAELLFNYLRNIFNFTAQEPLDLEKIDDDFVMLGKGLMYFEKGFTEYNEFAKSLARGDLHVTLPPATNEMAAPLKSLHASLKHLTWQSKQVARGDYKQRVDFMGEFASSFNTMIEQLAERQEKLENEIEQSNKYAQAMERSNLLLSNLMYHIPQQIFVVSTDKREVLFFNDLAKAETDQDPSYITKLLGKLPGFDNNDVKSDVEVCFDQENGGRYLLINSYPIEWEKTNAVVFIIRDISDEKKQMKKLEVHAFYDALTGLYNRFYGMLMLNDWLTEEKSFSLVFIDLDNLKFINDKYGHEEGDKYLIKVAKYLADFSDNAIVCRLGGDEYMMLLPGVGQDETNCRMNELQSLINNDEYLHDKDYIYSFSFGIVEVAQDFMQPASVILSIADERMYEHKRARKMNRRTPSN